MKTERRILVSIHLPTIKSTINEFIEPLVQIETLLEKFKNEEIIIGADTNAKVYGYENGWSIGPATVPFEMTARDHERARHFDEFLSRKGLLLANTWRQGDLPGEATKKPWKHT